MDRSAVINSKDFKFELFKSKDPVECNLANSKNVKYTSIPFTYNDKEALFMMDGTFRSFTSVKDGNMIYSITMTVDNSNEEFLKKLESRIKKLVGENYKKDVFLIKSNDKEYKSLSLKAYASKLEGNLMNCKFRKQVNGKLETVPPEDMAERKFTGKCVFKIVDLYVGSFKTVRMVPREFLVHEVESEMIFFR